MNGAPVMSGPPAGPTETGKSQGTRQELLHHVASPFAWSGTVIPKEMKKGNKETLRCVRMSEAPGDHLM